MSFSKIFNIFCYLALVCICIGSAVYSLGHFHSIDIPLIYIMLANVFIRFAKEEIQVFNSSSTNK
jgi:hypothetical protein